MSLQTVATQIQSGRILFLILALFSLGYLVFLFHLIIFRKAKQNLELGRDASGNRLDTEQITQSKEELGNRIAYFNECSFYAVIFICFISLCVYWTAAPNVGLHFHFFGKQAIHRISHGVVVVPPWEVVLPISLAEKQLRRTVRLTDGATPQSQELIVMIVLRLQIDPERVAEDNVDYSIFADLERRLLIPAFDEAVKPLLFRTKIDDILADPKKVSDEMLFEIEDCLMDAPFAKVVCRLIVLSAPDGRTLEEIEEPGMKFEN